MNLDLLALIALVFAGIPAGLFLLNLLVYRPIANRKSQTANSVSVLIPARNEERNIRATLHAVLANHGCDFEIIVLDDHSTDRTAAIVSELAREDARVRLESAPALPAGWCGKQHACFVLSMPTCGSRQTLSRGWPGSWSAAAPPWPAACRARNLAR
jgi:cellulose synthase/poly-beta-1,6-N-acetylglucosamine synthase-like glycosyltransferase